MVTVKKISINELPSLVYLSYEGDNDLFDKYTVHKALGENKHIINVNSELAYIYEMREKFDTKYYKVIYQKKPIGYFVTFGNNLYSFSINKKYRKKDILIDWWQKIRQTLNSNFNCLLYNNNERAISFLLKNRMKIVEVDNENNVTLLTSY